MDDDHASVLRRIHALLAKAESTTFPEEAEALAAKAQELITRHSIDAALVAAAAGRAVGEASRRRLTIVEPYIGPKALLLAGIAEANRCRVVWSSEGSADVFGFEADLDATEVLWVALLTHAVAALARLSRPRDSAAGTRSFRRSFLIAFGARVRERLAEAAQAVETEVAAQHGASLLPVLVERDEAVARALKAAHPRTRKAQFRVRDAAGWQAGRTAADDADLGARALR